MDIVLEILFGLVGLLLLIYLFLRTPSVPFPHKDDPRPCRNCNGTGYNKPSHSDLFTGRHGKCSYCNGYGYQEKRLFSDDNENRGDWGDRDDRHDRRDRRDRGRFL